MEYGTFIDQSNGDISGKIECPFPRISCEVVFRKVTEKPNDNAPDYRIFTGKAELGVAWIKEHGNVEGNYLSVKLDAPAFEAPINCALFRNADGTRRLTWDRPEQPKAKQ